MFANHNDFLASDDDVAWLTDQLGPERVRVFPAGGHLGNLHRPEVQSEIMRSPSDLAAARLTPCGRGPARSRMCGLR